MPTNTELTAGLQLLPKLARVTGVGTTWQRFDLPPIRGARRYTIKATGDIYYATESGGDDDGDAVSTPYVAVAAAESAVGWFEGLPEAPGQRVRFILVAAQSGTVDVSVSLEG